MNGDKNVFKVILTIIFVVAGLGVIGATYAYVLAMIGSMFVAIYFVKKASVYFVKKAPEIKRYKDKILKELTSYSWPLLFNSFLILVISWIDTIMLGYFKSASDVGIYNAAMPTSMLKNMNVLMEKSLKPLKGFSSFWSILMGKG